MRPCGLHGSARPPVGFHSKAREGSTLVPVAPPAGRSLRSVHCRPLNVRTLATEPASNGTVGGYGIGFEGRLQLGRFRRLGVIEDHTHLALGRQRKDAIGHQMGAPKIAENIKGDPVDEAAGIGRAEDLARLYPRAFADPQAGNTPPAGFDDTAPFLGGIETDLVCVAKPSATIRGPCSSSTAT